MRLIERGINFDRYTLGGQRRVIAFEGEIDNCIPWNTGGLYVPARYDWADIEHVSSNIKRLSTGRFAYTVNLSKNAQGGMLGGEIRIHPVPGHWGVYYSVAPKNPVDLDVRQVTSGKEIEIYKDTANVRYSFIINRRGYKINNRLKSSYASDSFAHAYYVSIQGLTKSERKLLYQGQPVAMLPNPFMTVNATGEVLEVTETLNGGELTLSASGIQALDLSQGIDVDPSLGPIDISRDTWIRNALPTFGFGQTTTTLLGKAAANNYLRALSYFDISAIPSTATVNSADWEVYVSAITGFATFSFDHCRLTRTGWEEEGAPTAGVEANWNDWATGQPWTTPGGDIDALVIDQTVSKVFTAGAYNTMSIINNAQDAVTNRSGALHFLSKLPDEAAAGNSYLTWVALQGAAGNRPKLTIVYTEAAATSLMGGGLFGASTLSAGGFNNFGGFGL